MAGGKETPRQKMIGMMYLVLTALLALNVSKEILNAFVIMNDGIEVTNTNTDAQINAVLGEFANSMAESPEKTKPWKLKADKVHNMTVKMLNYVEQLKGHTISNSEGKEIGMVLGTQGRFDTTLGLEYVDGLDNYDKPTYFLGLADVPTMVKNPEGAVTKGEKEDVDVGVDLSANELQIKLEKYANDLIAELDPSQRTEENVIYRKITSSFIGIGEEKIEYESGETHTWASHRCYHAPLAAVVANFTQIQSDIRSLEIEVLNYLATRIDAASYKFNKLSPKFISNSSYLLRGDTFRAEVFLAAFDTTADPVIEVAPDYLDSAAMTFGEDALGPDNLQVKEGKGFVSIPADQEGIFTLKGVVKFTGPDGTIIPFRVATSYQVAAPSLTVSPTKMNVFYKGVENPVSISAPGVPADKIRPSISNGSIKKGTGGGYIVTVSKGSEAIISVSAEVNGETVQMGKVPFRVKSVPDPTPKFAGKGTGDSKVKKSQLTAAQGVIAKMENFEFDLKFTVTSFKLTMIVGGTPIEQVSNSNRITSDMKAMLKKAKPGTKVYIEAIKAKGPDGTVRKLGGLSLKVT